MSESLERLHDLARRFKDAHDLYIIGRGLSYPVALEAAVKIQELSYIHAEGHAGGELKHYAIALIEPGTPCLALVPDDETRHEIVSNATEVKARGGTIIGIAPEAHPIFDVYVPFSDAGMASPIVNLVPIQVLAYYLAVERGFDPDMPRNLATINPRNYVPKQHAPLLCTRHGDDGAGRSPTGRRSGPLRVASALTLFCLCPVDEKGVAAVRLQRQGKGHEERHTHGPQSDRAHGGAAVRIEHVESAARAISTAGQEQTAWCRVRARSGAGEVPPQAPPVMADSESEAHVRPQCHLPCHTPLGTQEPPAPASRRRRLWASGEPPRGLRRSPTW